MFCNIGKHLLIFTLITLERLFKRLKYQTVKDREALFISVFAKSHFLMSGRRPWLMDDLSEPNLNFPLKQRHEIVGLNNAAKFVKVESFILLLDRGYVF